MTLVAAIFALLIGVCLGMLGAGGSAITVPVFAYVIGLTPKAAISSSLPVIGIVSLVGALRHWRCGNLNSSVALLFAPASMLGAFGGARLAAYAAGSVQMVLFACVMLTAAVLMFRDSGRMCATTELPPDRSRGKPWKLMLLGAAVGAMTGLVGVGGGFLIVPALVIFQSIPMRTAIGTSLAIIAANSGAGFAGYIGQVTIPWGLVGGFALIASAGILLGAGLCKQVSQTKLRRGFAVFLASIAVFILAERWYAPESPNPPSAPHGDVGIRGGSNDP